MRSRTLFSLVSLSAFMLSGIAHAGFIGQLQLLPPGCEASTECRLGQDFGFVDSAGVGWQAAKGLLTDGASIPEWAKPFIGASFEPAFIKAAVIHDHYCVRRVRPWRQTHKVFHEALLSSGVSPMHAGIMYLGVLVGGPKWVKLVPGKSCPVGMGCINQVDVSASAGGSSLGFSAASAIIMKRPADYGSSRFRQRFEQGLSELLSSSTPPDAAKIEALASGIMATDFYFRNGDEVGTTLGVTIQTE